MWERPFSNVSPTYRSRFDQGFQAIWVSWHVVTCGAQPALRPAHIASDFAGWIVFEGCVAGLAGCVLGETESLRICVMDPFSLFCAGLAATDSPVS